MTLQTKNTGYWYTNNPNDYLFKDVNLTFEKGKVYSILGQEAEKQLSSHYQLDLTVLKLDKSTWMTQILTNLT